jgi:6-phosphogluconolactonase
VYACSEDISKDNEIAAFAVSPTTGELTHLCSQSAEGKSTCYLTLDMNCKNILYVNYWDSVIGVMPVSETGMLSPTSFKLQPSKPVMANGLAEHLANRQSEPHSHAIILDPYYGKVAFVPDLGEDDIKTYHYDEDTGVLTPSARISAGPAELKPHGPRYCVFHPKLNILYLVNELSSTVSVFEYSSSVGANMEAGKDVNTLRFMQNIRTIPSAFPKELNTCGRICIDPSGNYVLVSNRGHDSIAVFRIDDDSSSCGEGGKLSVVSYTHTRGKTPRHFQFSPDGEYLIAANQDANNISIFRFVQETGELLWTSQIYDVDSPNFVAIAQCHPNGRRFHGLP